MLKSFHLFILIGGGALIGAAPWVSAQDIKELKPQTIYERVSPSVITLKVLNSKGERFTGSGFMALAEGVAVTAWHTVHDARQVDALLADGRRVEVEGLLDRDESRDIALIRLKVEGLPLAKLREAPAAIGSRLYVIGAPRGFGFSIADGLLSQVRVIDDVRLYQVSCPFSMGNSGGPVVDEFGEVVGLASWSRVDAQNLNFATPVEHVMALDPLHPLTYWQDLPQLRGEGTEKVEVALVNQPDDDLEALRRYLRKVGGRKVTVVVQQAEENRTFRFEVPE